MASRLARLLPGPAGEFVRSPNASYLPTCIRNDFCGVDATPLALPCMVSAAPGFLAEPSLRMAMALLLTRDRRILRKRSLRFTANNACSATLGAEWRRPVGGWVIGRRGIDQFGISSPIARQGFATPNSPPPAHLLATSKHTDSGRLWNTTV